MTMRRVASRLLAPTAATVCALVAAASLPLAARAAPAPTVGSAASSSTSSRAGAATLQADYKFEGNLKSSVSGAPRLANVGTGNFFRRDRVPGEGRTRVLVFPSGNGLKAFTKGVVHSHDYSVVMQFRLATAGTDVYARILNPTLPRNDSDNGLYLLNDHLVFWDFGAQPGQPGTIAAGKYVEVGFTRAISGKLRVYVNGQPDISSVDTDGWAGIADHLLRFFVDNSNDESSKGSVSRIRLYDGALTARRVKRIYAQGH